MPDTAKLSDFAFINPATDTNGTAAEAPVAFIPMAAVAEGGGWRSTENRPLSDGRRGYTLFQRGDVIVAKITPCFENGKVALLSDLETDFGLGSTEFHVLRAKAGHDPRFIYHWTRHPAFLRAGEASMTGSAGQRRVPAGFFERFGITKIEGASQSLIADILDAIDDAILETDTVIEKLRVIRSGMIDDLLSRGVGCSGRLRGVSETVSTSIGMKAAVWPLRPLGTLVELINGFAFKPNDWLSDGVPIIRIQNLNGGTDFNYTSLEVPEKYHVAPGELLFSWSGNRGTSFGPFIWRGPFGYVNQHIFRVIPKTGISHRWLYFALDEVRVRAERFAHGGSGLVHVKRSDLENYLVAVPEFDEQEEIADRLESIQSRIDRLSDERAKLSSLRGGLRDDLLTGRKPVLAIREAAE